MSLRARIFMIISIAMLLILGISLFLIVRSKTKSAAPESATVPNGASRSISNGQPGGQQQVSQQIPTDLPAKTATPVEAEKNGAVQLAKVFVERYGTYSSDNNFQNIKEVESFVTPNLWSQISALMNSKAAPQSFVGMTTKVISMNLVNWSDVRATVELKTIRTEERNGAVASRQQNATVYMVKQDSVWLADRLVWN